MKRLLLCMMFGAALLLHFHSGIWSEAQEPKGKEAKVDAKDVKPEVRAEEKKEEAKKPPEGDKTGANNKDLDFASKELKELDPEKATLKDVATALVSARDGIGINRAAINMFWTLMTGFLVMFMQAGFALVETGLCRYKNVAHTMAMNFMIYGIGMLGFYLVGFAIMYGGIGTSFFGNDAGLLTSEYKLKLFGKELGIFGYEGFLLTGRAFDMSLLAMFLFQMVFMDTTCTIPTGAMAERWKFSSFVIFGFVISTVIYPVFGNWVWGGGWLAQLGSQFELGHGHVDFAGSSVVHMTGGVCALAGAIMIGPRLGKFNKDGSVNVLPAHSVPMYMLGTFILAFGWFGFNPGSALKATDPIIARCAVNTMLASATGAFASMVYMWLVYGKPDPSFMCNGMLAGLVAITAPCAFITPGASCIVGLVAGVLVIWSCVFWEKIAKVDDPVGAISVHGVNGAWGVLALGLLADGSYGQGWNGSFWYKVNETKYEWSSTSLSGGTAKEALEAIDDANKDKKPGEDKIEAPGFLKSLAPTAKLEAVGVTGLFYGSTGQFKAQCIGTATNIVFVLIMSFTMFGVTGLIVGNRVAPETELAGLDVPEMGILGYINEDPKTPEGHLAYAGAEPRPALVPPGGKRFAIVVEGINNGEMLHAWSEMCQPGKAPDPEVFKEVYKNMTTVQGGRFVFRGGDPDTMKSGLQTLLQGKLKGKMSVQVMT